MYTPNTNTISNSELKTGQMKPNLLASRDPVKKFYTAKKKMAFYSDKTWDIYVYVYVFFLTKKKEYKNFKYRQPKAIPNVLTFNFRNIN